jgi:hypothetical protein
MSERGEVFSGIAQQMPASDVEFQSEGLISGDMRKDIMTALGNEVDPKKMELLEKAIENRKLDPDKDKESYKLKRRLQVMAGLSFLMGDFESIPGFDVESNDFEHKKDKDSPTQVEIAADIVWGLKHISSDIGSAKGAGVGFGKLGRRDFDVLQEQALAGKIDMTPEEVEAMREGMPSEPGGRMTFALSYYMEQWMQSMEEAREHRDKFEGAMVPDYLWLEELEGENLNFQELSRDEKTNKIDWLQVNDKMARQARRILTWQWMVDICTSPGVEEQIARWAARGYLPMEMLDVSSAVAELPGAARALEEFYGTLLKNKEDVEGQLIGVTPSGTNLMHLLTAMRRPVVAEMRTEVGRKGRHREIKKEYAGAEIGVAEALDIIEGNTGKTEKDESGNPYYIIKGKKTTLAEYSKGKSKKQLEALLSDGSIRSVFSDEVDPLRNGRTRVGERLFTIKDWARDEMSRSEHWRSLIKRMEDNGADWSKTDRLLLTATDGKPMSKDHPLIRDYRRQLVGGGMSEVEAGAETAKWMVMSSAIIRDGKLFSWGVMMAEALQLSSRYDVQQLMDHNSELTIKAQLLEGYLQKYQIAPVLMRRFVQSFARSIIPWKRKQIDPVMMAANGVIEPTMWRNPLNPDEAPPIAPLYLKRSGGDAPMWKHIQDGTEGEVAYKVLENLFYIKSDFRVRRNVRNLDAAELVALAEDGVNRDELLKLASEMYDWDIDARSRNTDDITKPGKASVKAPQEFVRSRQEVFAVANSLKGSRREQIKNVNFKNFLSSMGYENMDLTDVEYMGWFGVMKVAEMRSVMHFNMGALEKLFKYLAKYPSLAAAHSKALWVTIPKITQALDPIFENLLGERPEAFGGFTPDQADEAIVKQLIDLGMMGRRKPSEIQKYIGEITEAVFEVAGTIGFMGSTEARASLIDLVSIIDQFSDDTVQSLVFKYDKGEGEHGTTMKPLEIDFSKKKEGLIGSGMSESEAREEIIKREARAVAALRAAGFTAIFPAGADVNDNKDWLKKHGIPVEDTRRPKAYPSHGIQMAYKVEGKIRNGRFIPEVDTKTEVLSLYGHRGKEALTVFLVMEALKDRNDITELDMARALLAIGINEERQAEIRRAMEVVNYSAWEKLKDQFRRVLPKKDK